MKLFGYDVECLPQSDPSSGEYGLKYANNEVCYPATLIVGDIVKAFASGRYDPKECAVAMSQTGGQCRASNYLGLIRKALDDAGFPEVPIVSFGLKSGLWYDQPGFELPWKKMIAPAVRILLYSDVMNKFYHASVVRERRPGLAKSLLDKYLGLAKERIEAWDVKGLYGLMADAAAEFDKACIDRKTAKVGVVGEIFLEFNPYSHRHVIEWLENRGIEVAPLVLTDFFIQEFVSHDVNVRSHIINGNWLQDSIMKMLYGVVQRQIRKVNKICSAFRYFVPFGDVRDDALRAEKVISLNAQFGEGWLLPGEILSYADEGIDHVISMQPFGCIANHIVSKGVEKRIREICPQMRLLSLDFDSGVSEVNVTNRLLLFIDNLPVYGHETANV
jgi:predicted nucleotide-binding protein (sugar kinase/HSP70/actin superfamily)